MIDNRNIAPFTIYYQMETNNTSFLEMHHFLKAKGVQNNKFFMILFDADLAAVNPFDPRLNTIMKQKILRETITNYWYYLREVVRIPVQGGSAGSGVRFNLHRANLAFNFCCINNYNIFMEIPRQQGKTLSVLVRLLWEYQFGSTNNRSLLVNKKHDDSKRNLQDLKDYRDALPEYLRLNEIYGRDGKIIKAKNAAESIQHPLNNNIIQTLPAARSKAQAMTLGRGMSVGRVYLDEYSFMLHNSTIYLSMMPAFKTASLNAKNNGAPYGIIITTTPGDLTTEEGQEANNKRKLATPFNEHWYDMTKEQLDEMISKNTSSSFVYIRFTYQQLGRDEEWLKEMIIGMERKYSDIRREVLLEWAESSDNSPFKKEDLKIVGSLVKEPIETIMLNTYYQFNIYEKYNPKNPPIIGVDVSGGFQRDSSAISVIDSETTKLIADMNCNWISTVDLASVIYELVTKYMSNAVVNIERNGGYGASVLARLIKTQIKKNLYYEIKDKVIEERFNGTRMTKKTEKTKVFGLDSSKGTRELLMEILDERMKHHKDKFISKILYEELKTLEVKKNGRIEHTATGHDDQVFAYLMALYVWYEGKNLMDKFGIYKKAIKTDEDLDEAVIHIEEKYADIIEEIETEFNDDDEKGPQVKKQLEYLNSNKTMTYEEWMQQQHQEDEAAMQKLLNTRLGRKVYAQKFNCKQEDLQNGIYNIPQDVFNDFYNNN